MPSASELFEAMAAAETPEPLSSYTAARLSLWTSTQGAAKDGVSERLKAYAERMITELDQAQPGWYDDLLEEQGDCYLCGMSYRLENLAFCTHCETFIGPGHPDEIAARAPNGNPLCPLCLMGEIVG